IAAMATMFLRPVPRRSSSGAGRKAARSALEAVARHRRREWRGGLLLAIRLGVRRRRGGAPADDLLRLGIRGDPRGRGIFGGRRIGVRVRVGGGVCGRLGLLPGGPLGFRLLGRRRWWCRDRSRIWIGLLLSSLVEVLRHALLEAGHA